MSKKASKTKLYAVFVLVILALAATAGYYYQITQKAPAKTAAVFYYFTDFPNLDPTIAFENQQIVLANVYEDLVYFDPNSTRPLQPWLATSWDTSSDGLTWTFHLRTGVTFHDGTPFTAEAVKFSIDRAKTLGLGAAYIWDPVQQINVIDDNTIQFQLKYLAPLAQIASSTYGAWIISPKTPENATDWFNAGHDSGTGPYMIASNIKGTEVILEKYPNYWRGWEGNHLDNVVFKVQRDPSVSLQAVQSGEADITTDLPVDVVSNAQGDTRVVIYDAKSYKNLVGMINTVRPPTDNVLVRQALSYAFPYEDVISSVWKGRAKQSTGPIPYGMLGHFDDLPRYNLDLDKAHQLLTQAGYPNGGFTITLTYNSGDFVEKQISELYQAELAKLNVTLEIREMSTDAEQQLARGDPMQAQHIYLLYWWPTYITPYDFMYSMFHSSSTVIFNFAYYNNTQYDSLIDQANQREGTDITAALQMYKQAQEILIRDAPGIFIFDQDQTFIYKTSLHNFSYNPAYTEVVFFYNMWKDTS